MKSRILLLPLITFFAIITSCGKDELTTVNSDLTAKPSMFASHNINNKTKLDVPVLTTTVTGTTVVVSWAPVANANEYHVVFEGTGAPASQKTTATSITVSDISDGNFTVKVSALVNSGTSMFLDSGFGASSAFTVGSVPPVVTVTKLATPVLTANQVSYNSGKGNTTVTWGNITNATAYAVTLNGNPISSAASPLSLANLEPGTYVLGVTALSGNAGNLNSDPGTATIIVKDRRPINTPVISGSVSYSSASAGSVSVNPLFIWPPNNKLTTVTFVGSGILSTGTGTINASHTTVTNATSYSITPSTLSNLAPGTYTVSMTAIAGGTYTDDNWVNSVVGNKPFDVLAGSLSYKLVDEYGVYTKSYTLSSNFNLPIQLMASRLGTDMDGRDYTFIVTATNGGGVSVNASTVSNVPHDQRK